MPLLNPNERNVSQTPTKLATWTKPGTQKGDPYSRQRYYQIDYVQKRARWNNAFSNMESDLHTSIDSDNATVLARSLFKAKKYSTA